MLARWIGIIALAVGFLQASGTEQLDAYIEKARTDWDAVGLAVGVVHEGEVILLKGYGNTHLDRVDPITPDTQFPIGSVTKSMIAQVLFALNQEGAIDFEGRIAQYLPQISLQDPFASHHLRVKDLITHRIGLPDHAGDLLYLTQLPGERLERMYFIPPTAPFRQNFSYQNLSYVALGELIEKVAQEHWSKVLYRRIFAPLAMHRTHASFETLPVARHVAFGHAKIQGKKERLEWSDSIDFGAAGGVVSTARELLRWVESLMDQKELIRPQVFLTREPVRKMLYPTSKWAGYGMGWYVQEFSGRHLVDHSGNIPGITVKVGWVPEERIGVVVLCNEERSLLPHAIMMRVVEQLMYMPRRDWSASLLQVSRNSDQWSEQKLRQRLSSRRSNAPASFEPVGRFSHPLYGEADVADGVVRIGSRLEGFLEHWHYNTYRIRWKSKLGKLYPGPIRATFSLDALAKVARMDVERLGEFGSDQGALGR